MEIRSEKIGWRVAAATFALAAALASVAPGASGRPAHTRAPGGAHGKQAKQRGAYWGAWIGPQLTGGQPPWDMSAVSRFEGLTGKGLSLIEFAAPFLTCEASSCSPYRFPASEMNTIRNYGAIPFFSWGSQSTPVPLDINEPGFQLADLSSGAYDSYIREFAEAAKAWGHPFFLRFDWEMNGNWFLWSEGVNGNQPGEYVAAWRHVHDIFTEVGATNAQWVWCPYADAPHRFPPIKRYYPGGAYVDWTCLDGFNWANNGVNPQPWRNFNEIFGTSYREIVKKIAPRKPMLLAEMASGGSGRAKAAWIRGMFKQLRVNYRRIRGLIWFDQVDRGVEWPIETSAASTRAFARGLRQPGYKANHYEAIAGPIRPPR
jgi:mannan endo-1,4-beta-mannosidase